MLADITQIAAGNGYTNGGQATTISVAEVAGVTTISGTQVVFTAAGGAMGPLRYAVLYNDTATSPADALIGWWDYGSSISLQDGENITVKFNNASPGAILTIG